MEKQDILVIVAAIAIVLIMAVVVKPLITGEPVTLLPEGMLGEGQVSDSGEVDMIDTQPVYVPVETEVQYQQTPVQDTPPPTIAQTPVPTAQKGLTWQPDPDNPMPNIQMITYAEIIGRYSGATDMFVIPVPYWEVQYELSYEATVVPEFSIDVHEVKDGVDSILRTMTFKQDKKPDPTENRFYEGGYTYYITISAKDLAEYKIQILVPEKYIA